MNNTDVTTCRNNGPTARLDADDSEEFHSDLPPPEEPLPAWVPEILPYANQAYEYGAGFRRELGLTRPASAADLRRILDQIPGLEVKRAPLPTHFWTSKPRGSSGPVRMSATLDTRTAGTRAELGDLAFIVVCGLFPTGPLHLGSMPDATRSEVEAAGLETARWSVLLTAMFLDGLNKADLTQL